MVNDDDAAGVEGPLAMFHRLLAENAARLLEVRRKHPHATNFVTMFAALPIAGQVIVHVAKAGDVLAAESVLFSPNYFPSRVLAFDVLGAPVQVTPRSPTDYALAPGTLWLSIKCTREVRGMVKGWTWPAE